MRLTGIVAGRDGMGFTAERSTVDLGEMLGEQLAAGGDTFEVLDLDDICIAQRGRTELIHRGEVLAPEGRIYAPSPISICPLRERKMANIYHVLLEQGVPLLNRSFAASPQLEFNKTVMQALVSQLDIPCIPTMDLNAFVPPEAVFDAMVANGFELPVLLKPNRLSNGVGILKCEAKPDFIEKVRLVQQLRSDYLIQKFVPHVGDLRTFYAREGLLGHRLREPTTEGEFRANLSGGAKWRASELPDQVAAWCRKIAARCDADYIVMDWLVSETGYYFNEMCSTLGAFMGVPPKMKRKIAETIVEIGRKKVASSRYSVA